MGYADEFMLVLATISEMVRRARGGHVAFKPRKVALMAGLRATPRNLAMINHILKELTRKGYIVLWKRGPHGTWYILPRSSPLWRMLERGLLPSPEELQPLGRPLSF